jgi:hypothetical protein
MAAGITRLRTRQERYQADRRKQLALALAEEAEHGTGRLAEEARALLAKVRQDQANSDPWVFVMIDATQFAAVHGWLARNSERPIVAMHLWGLLFAHLDRDTGEILASRAELAGLVNARPQHVSRIMGELEALGAISRRRMPANGPVRYFMNPRLGTHLAKAPREAAQAAAPPLRLVEPA